MRRPPTARALTIVLAVALGFGLAACGGDGDDEETGTSTTASTEAGADSSTEPDGTTTTETPTSAGDEPDATIPPGELPGEPIEIFPYEGARLGVVGVAAGDTLNVRTGPGTDFEVVTELDPLSQEPTATGQNRTVDDAIWVEVDVDGTLGWVNGAYVAEPGAVVDITAEVGAVSAASLPALGEAVAAARVGEGGGEGAGPAVTIVDGPTEGDLGEITVDVIGLADDAQKGERLHVFATPDPGGEGFVLRTVEATALCARGVTDDGLCT